jgi:uncharacterized membrane protein YkoI
MAMTLAFSGQAFAAEPRECLGKAESQALVANGQVVPLAAAIQTARLRRADVVSARLCRGPKGYVYLLTLLARDGKVTRATVDANTLKGASAS